MKPGQYQNLINTHEKLKIKDRLTVIQPVFNSAPRRKNDTEPQGRLPMYVCLIALSIKPRISPLLVHKLLRENIISICKIISYRLSSSAAFHIFFLRKNIIVFKMRSRCLSSGASSGKSGNFPKCNQYINTRSILHLVLSSKIKQVQKRFLRLGRFHLPGYATVSPLFVRA
jgi:hypothetical protein